MKTKLKKCSTFPLRTFSVAKRFGLETVISPSAISVGSLTCFTTMSKCLHAYLLLQYLSKYLQFLCRLSSYLYPCDTILLSVHVLVSCNHTKTHALVL